MPKCNVCKTFYEEPQRKFMISKKIYWCALCCNFKLFNPLPPQWFSPEVDMNTVLQKQKNMYDCGKRDGYFRN